MRWACLAFIAMNSGCLQMQRIVEWIDPPPDGSREPSLVTAARVDQVGRQIISANPFTGIEASFQVIGQPDALIFHRDHYSVFISDALVEQCATDAELAAVLCSELGRMVAERRNLSRMGYLESFSQVPSEAGDAMRTAELALQAKAENTKELTDPKKIALEMLQTAGHDPALLAKVEPILRGANRNRDVLRQLGGVGAEPAWSR